jgi:hypothetical protein
VATRAQDKPLKVVGETVGEQIAAMDKRAAENLRIWKALGKTDPAHTKQFSRAGGFKGTAIKPIWITQRLTEQFGPCGVGWGMTEPQFQVVPAGDEVLVYCTVAGWYDADPASNKIAQVYGVGGDKIVTKRNDGKLFHDDEAFKKAFTDAIGNAFKFIGVGADVHMGLFEDSKYLAEMTKEFHPKPDNPTAGEPKKREKTTLNGPYDTLPKLEKAAREFVRTLRGMSSLEEFEDWKQDKEVIAFVEQCKRDLPGWWFANHSDCPPDFTPLSVEVASTRRGLAELAELNGANA